MQWSFGERINYGRQAINKVKSTQPGPIARYDQPETLDVRVLCQKHILLFYHEMIKSKNLTQVPNKSELYEMFDGRCQIQYTFDNPG